MIQSGPAEAGHYRRKPDWDRLLTYLGSVRLFSRTWAASAGRWAASAGAGGIDARNHAARIRSDDPELAARDRGRIHQRRADADRHGAGSNPVAGIVERHAAGRHQ